MKRIRSLITGTMGTLIEMRSDGWSTVLWDGAPCQSEIYGGLTRKQFEFVRETA